MTRLWVFSVAVLVAGLSIVGHAQAQITPGQIPVFIDAAGKTMDSFIAQPGGNASSPIQITDGTTSDFTFVAANWGIGRAVAGTSMASTAAIFISDAGPGFAGVWGLNTKGGTGVYGSVGNPGHLSFGV